VLGRQSCSSDIINEHHFHLELDETLPEPIRDAASSTIMNGSFLLLCFYFQEKKDAERKRPFISDPSGSSCWRLVLLTGPIELAATSDVGGNSLRSILLVSPLPPFCPAFQQTLFLEAFDQIYWLFTTHQLLNDTSGSYDLPARSLL
jgi:hypothetical protein